MSHFTVMIFGENAEEQLAPFSENLETPRYVAYTKEQLIANERKSIEDYKNGTYMEYLSDKEAYLKGCRNDSHARYLENEFPKKLKWTDKEVYQESIRFYDESEIGENGEVYSERNPNSKWDWYQLGGRWAGSIKIKEGVAPMFPLNFSWGWDEEEKQKLISENRADCALKGDIENLDDLSCFSIIKDGQWYQRGDMGWWGIVSDEISDEEWKSKCKELIMGLSDDTLISIYDCHI